MSNPHGVCYISPLNSENFIRSFFHVNAQWKCLTNVWNYKLSNYAYTNPNNQVDGQGIGQTVLSDTSLGVKNNWSIMYIIRIIRLLLFFWRSDFVENTLLQQRDVEFFFTLIYCRPIALFLRLIYVSNAGLDRLTIEIPWSLGSLLSKQWSYVTETSALGPMEWSSLCQEPTALITRWGSLILMVVNLR